MKKKYILVLVSFGLFISCLKPNCEENAKLARNRECLLIIEQELPTSTPYLKARGRNLKTSKSCECLDKGRWWVQYRNYMSVGDTLIKHKGELVFYIHKNDTILSFPWQCDGKIYK